jgi:hypothetical protein
MVDIFSSPPFYTRHVQLPTAEYSTPAYILNNPRFYPYFKNALGALDGTHIRCAPPALQHAFFRNRKGFLSQNCLFACGFDLRFVYSLCGWEGSATDARVYEAAHHTDLHIPAERYYLADAGYPSCHQLMVPYRKVQHHLAEWGCAKLR